MEKNYSVAEIQKLGVDTSKLTFIGTMNYIVQAWRSKDENTGEVHIEYDQYHPRRNKIFHGYDDMTEDELKKDMAETIERMKIAQKMMQDFIDGKTDYVYYWQAEDEKENCKNWM